MNIRMLATVALCSNIMLFTSCDMLKKKNDTKGTEVTSKKLVQLESGMSYETLTEAPADAKSPEAGQQVTVHYTGWLDEEGKKGKKFDSSIDRNQKFTFTVGKGYVIKGWEEGVMSMKVGEKRLLRIPSELAYGDRGAGNVIPANADLIFEVELFDIQS